MYFQIIIEKVKIVCFFLKCEQPHLADPPLTSPQLSAFGWPTSPVGTNILYGWPQWKTKWYKKGVFYNYVHISNTKQKLAKDQVNAKEHPESQLLLFENYLHSSSMSSSKNNKTS